MLKQYPHFLYKHEAPTATINANGSWTEDQSGAWTFAGACREETNGKGTSITTADGRALVFSSLIQMPVGAERISEGTEVAIFDTELPAEAVQNFDAYFETYRPHLRIKGINHKFDSGRLHCRMWI